MEETDGSVLTAEEKRKKGLYRKFNVERTDGRSAPGEKHHECQYLVLDITCDRHAIPAMRAYADDCKEDLPLLAFDLYEAAKALEKKFAEEGK